MTSKEQITDLRVQVIAAWLDEKGFSDAATRLLGASDEVAERVAGTEYIRWLDYQDELKKAHRTLGSDDDLFWL